MSCHCLWRDVLLGEGEGVDMMVMCDERCQVYSDRTKEWILFDETGSMIQRSKLQFKDIPIYSKSHLG